MIKKKSAPINVVNISDLLTHITFCVCVCVCLWERAVIIFLSSDSFGRLPVGCSYHDNRCLIERQTWNQRNHHAHSVLMFVCRTTPAADQQEIHSATITDQSNQKLIHDWRCLKKIFSGVSDVQWTETVSWTKQDIWRLFNHFPYWLISQV